MGQERIREYIDRGAIESVLDDGFIDNPYKDTETVVAKVGDVYPFLVTVARNKSTTDYWTVKEECGVFTARQSQVLGIIGLIEDKNNRPLLSAVVTRSSTATVGEKYFSMVEVAENRSERIPTTEEAKRELWEQHLEEVYEYWNQ